MAHVGGVVCPSDDEKLKNYTEILYAQARLIAGLNVDNPTKLADQICELM